MKHNDLLLFLIKKVFSDFSIIRIIHLPSDKTMLKVSNKTLK